MKLIEIYTVDFSVPTLVATCYRKDLAKVLERLDLLGKCVMLRTAWDMHDSDVLEAVESPIERRPTLDEMRSGCFVKVRGWDEMLFEGTVEGQGIRLDHNFYFHFEMRKFCGTTHKIMLTGTSCVSLDDCESWNFTPEMLTYVAPEAVK